MNMQVNNLQKRLPRFLILYGVNSQKSINLILSWNKSRINCDYMQIYESKNKYLSTSEIVHLCPNIKSNGIFSYLFNKILYCVSVHEVNYCY